MSTTHLPTLSNNGTRKQDLIDRIADTIDALDAAGKKLMVTAPNGRDYYLTPGSGDLAELAFSERREVICKLIRDLDADMMAIFSMEQ